MTLMNVLVTGVIAEAGLDLLRGQGDLDVDFRPKLPREEILKIIADYHALVVRSETTVDAEIIQTAKKLKIIARAGVGVNNIDIKVATEHGIAVSNTPYANTISVAEHTIALILALARNVYRAGVSLKQDKKWERTLFKGIELYGKTLGIIGLGEIGSEVVKRIRGFEMKVISYDPLVPKARADELQVELLPLDEVLRQSDIVTIHVPLIEETKNMIDVQQLALMKPSAFIVNCARGQIINEVALYDALVSKRIKGVALDVFVDEPAVHNPLLGLDNVVVTPHLAASTKEAQDTASIDIAKQVISFLSQDKYINIINLPFANHDELARMKPYHIG